MDTLIKIGLQTAGAAQLALCVASIAIPRCLRWGERTQCLIPLIRQMFFTYAGYILGTHLFFAGVSLFMADALLQGTPLANILLFFMGTWWFVRILCQFFYFDREGIPSNRFNHLAEALLVIMFFCLVGVYWGALLIQWM